MGEKAVALAQRAATVAVRASISCLGGKTVSVARILPNVPEWATNKSEKVSEKEAS